MNVFFSQSTTYQIVLFAILSISLLIQFFFYLNVYLRVAIHKPKVSKDIDQVLPPVSIIICAKNEEANLAVFLPLVLEQEYPSFEVIVVNDCSLDDTDMLLRRLSTQYSHLKVTTINPDSKFTHGKKLALTIGIKAAKNEWLLLTDADCRPVGRQWLATMASNFKPTIQVVLGYGGYLPAKGLLNCIIRFDAFFIGMQYLGLALMGKPYMGVGRNLAYRKELFFKNKGFASHSHIESGDDDLFVSEVAMKKATAVELRPEGHTLSVASTSFAKWVKQKRRHLTTSPLYKNGVKFWLTLEPLSRLLFWISIILLFVEQSHLDIVLILLAFRLVVTNTILILVMKRLKEKKLFLLSLMYDLLSPLFIGTLMLANYLTQKRTKWN